MGVYCCCLFRYRLSPETYGYTLVWRSIEKSSLAAMYITAYFLVVTGFLTATVGTVLENQPRALPSNLQLSVYISFDVI
jgi:hypothetical protein